MILRLLALLLAALVMGCATAPPPAPARVSVPWPNLKIAVFSDVHVYAPELGTSGAAWEFKEAGAFQMFRESAEILDTAVAQIITSRPDLVLVVGDLTAEGEKASHELVARSLAAFSRAGIPVLVIPGNHDVLNPLARGYEGAWARPVPSVSALDFAAIYAKYGYEKALSRDPASLSYVSEPFPGLRVLALDTARYEDNAAAGRQVTAGRIRGSSWAWIDRVLDQAAQDGVPVVAMMHHGLVEKFPGEERLFGAYLVQDREQVQKRLSQRGVKVVFTGHFHTLSIASAAPQGRSILDIEDGTLSQFPLGYRQVEIRDGHLLVSTDYLRQIPSSTATADAFYQRARATAYDHLRETVEYRLTRTGASAQEAKALAGPLADAYLQFLQGDVKKPEGWTWPPQGLGPIGTLAVWAIGDSAENLWKPLSPNDRELDWDLSAE